MAFSSASPPSASRIKMIGCTSTGNRNSYVCPASIISSTAEHISHEYELHSTYCLWYVRKSPFIPDSMFCIWKSTTNFLITRESHSFIYCLFRNFLSAEDETQTFISHNADSVFSSTCGRLRVAVRNLSLEVHSQAT